MHSRHVKILLKYISCLMFLKFQKHVCFHKFNIGGIMGLKITSLSQEPVNHSPLLN